MSELIEIYLLIVERAIEWFHLFREVSNFGICIEVPRLLSGVVLAPEAFPNFRSRFSFFLWCLYISRFL